MGATAAAAAAWVAEAIDPGDVDVEVRDTAPWLQLSRMHIRGAAQAYEAENRLLEGALLEGLDEARCVGAFDLI